MRFTTARNVTPTPLPLNILVLFLFPQPPSYFMIKSFYSYRFMTIVSISAAEKQCSHICVCEWTLFCFLLSCLVRAVQQFDFKFTIRWAPNKLRQGKWQRYACSTNLRFLLKAKEERNNPTYNISVQYVLVTRGQYVLRNLPIRVPLSKSSV